MGNYKLSFEECEIRLKKLAKTILKNKKIKNIWGVPRGGVMIAYRLSYLTGLPITANPKYNETCIVDDCVDSGATLHSFSNFKYFYVLIDKQKEGIKEWIDFWWEEKLNGQTTLDKYTK